jgi:hypothetical protein
MNIDEWKVISFEGVGEDIRDYREMFCYIFIDMILFMFGGQLAQWLCREPCESWHEFLVNISDAAMP